MTKTVSVAFIVFEMTQSLVPLLPVLICVTFSYSITNALSLSIFDVLTEMKNLPFLPVLKSEDVYEIKASEIMN